MSNFSCELCARNYREVAHVRSHMTRVHREALHNDLHTHTRLMNSMPLQSSDVHEYVQQTCGNDSGCSDKHALTTPLLMTSVTMFISAMKNMAMW